MKKYILSVLPLLLLFLVTTSGVSAAETETYTCSIERSRLDWRSDQNTGSNTVKNCTFPQFNTDLGYLTSANMTVFGKTDTVQRMENKDVSPHTMNSTVTVVLDVKNQDETADILHTEIAAANATLTAAPFDGEVDFDGTSGKTYDVEYAENEKTVMVTDTEVLKAFSGQGNLNLPVYALAEWNCTGSGNAACAVDTYAAVTATLTYVYEPFEADLSLNTCTNVTMKNGETTTISINGANGGDATTEGPTTITTQLPACVQYLPNNLNNWTCESNQTEGTPGSTVICTFNGTVPPNAFLPELPLEVQASGCETELVSYTIRATVGNESATQNNSVLCNAGIEQVSENPEVLGEQTSPTPSPKPTSKPNDDSDINPVDAEAGEDESGYVLGELANTGMFLIIPALFGILLIASVLWLRRKKPVEDTPSQE